MPTANEVAAAWHSVEGSWGFGRNMAAEDGLQWEVLRDRDCMSDVITSGMVVLARRDLLHMSSGVDFGEDRDQGHDLNHLWKDMVTGPGFLGSGLFKTSTVGSIAQFNRRIAAPGTRYYYASIEPDVLGMVLHYTINKSASDYLHERGLGTYWCRS